MDKAVINTHMQMCVCVYRKIQITGVNTYKHGY